MALTAKMIRFAEEYIVDLNATQAAIRAGYSAKTAKQIGQENLTKPDLQEYIQNLMDERSKRTEITADMVLKEYAKLGFSNITDYLKVEETDVVIDFVGEGENKQPVMQRVQNVRIFDTDTISRTKLDAVAEIKQTKEGIALKLHDKKGALDSIARHLGMFSDKIEVTGTLTIEQLLERL
ncbi:terminase small subunit [Paenibacillus sp. HN-1]|uniref:terminase small subunit n=1 Tax=Paenibacillus TaxID=44249 RepID=UPI001CA7FAC0|nr:MULTISPECIES: terminase small subunit [Paenibacillus]MBY9081213.1 terminase small subunit [Paenibacillus sp. CGMCC 1.18879]MBY9087250.1 terminase small subunit [Paenibacillus sinensis]